MDMGNLLAAQFPQLSHRASELRTGGLVQRMRAGGRVIHEELGLRATLDATSWRSDTARGWAAMAVGLTPLASIQERIELIRPFADDAHFAVREWAWLSVRPRVAADVPRWIAELRCWTEEGSERLRRFASEATRPRGVWSGHLPILKSHPELGLPIIEPLRADPSRYVQDSVSNWLNDAGKSARAWVIDTCARWAAESESVATTRITRRAMRNF